MMMVEKMMINIIEDKDTDDDDYDGGGKANLRYMTP